MKFHLQLSGPNLNRELALDPSGAEITFGRDPAADVPLADPDQHISRKHLAVRQGADGVELRITSALNGVQTSRGAAAPGHSLLLQDGDHFTLGAYRVGVVAMVAVVGVADADHFGDEWGLLQPNARTAVTAAAVPISPALPTPAGDDPFSHPDFCPAAPARRPSGPASPDPIARRSHRLDEWLSGASAGPDAAPAAAWTAQAALPTATLAGPFDAFLGRPAAATPRALSPDHVLGIHLPMPTPTPTPTFRAHAATGMAIPAVPAALSDDIWASLHDAPLPPHGNVKRLLDAASNDDPFGDWTDASAAPSAAAPAIRVAPAAAAVHSAVDPAVDPAVVPLDPLDAWVAFTRGLGLSDLPDAPDAPDVAGGDAANAARAARAEHAGTVVRTLIEALALLLDARADLKRELRADDRTMLSGRDNNPLKARLSVAELIQYLFAAHPVGGYMPAGRAVRESIDDLLIHEHATIAAARAAVEGTLHEFDPARLRQQLLKLRNGKSSLFRVIDSSRLWDAYELQHQTQSLHLADWLETLFARHFMPAYGRETQRLKRAAGLDASETPD